MVAQEILKQIGGNKMIAMTGANNFVDHGDALSFRIKSNKANYVKISLNSMDLYDVEYGKIWGSKYKVIAESKGIYNDMLKKDIEQTTELYLSL